jgi:aminoglycoside phosphotransferase (APT) family kinase protein
MLGGRLGRLKIVEANLDALEVVTEEIQGLTLQNAMVSSRQRELRGTCTRAVYLAGKWLREFQALSIDSQVDLPRPADPEDLVEYCQMRLDALVELGHSWPDARTLRRIPDWINRRLDATPQELLRRVWAHGDYGPFNLMWDGYRLTPIDFGTSKPEFPLVDVVYLIHRLEMLPLQFPWRKWPVTLWRQACLRGYGVEHAESIPIYQAMMLRHLLCRLLNLVRVPAKSRLGTLHAAWLTMRVRQTLDKLLDSA